MTAHSNTDRMRPQRARGEKELQGSGVRYLLISMSTQAKTHPGPAWLWGTAWSIQGLAILAVDFLEFQDRAVSFVVSGILAGLPLLGLYVLLLRRGRRRSLPTETVLLRQQDDL